MDARGNITEVLTDTPPQSVIPPVSSKNEDVKDSEMENLINAFVNQFPKGTYNHQKLKAGMYEQTFEINEDYRIKYLKDLNDMLIQAPADKKIEYLFNFTNMFKQKVIETTTNKEMKQLDSE